MRCQKTDMDAGAFCIAFHQNLGYNNSIILVSFWQNGGRACRKRFIIGNNIILCTATGK